MPYRIRVVRGSSLYLAKGCRQHLPTQTENSSASSSTAPPSPPTAPPLWLLGKLHQLANVDPLALHTVELLVTTLLANAVNRRIGSWLIYAALFLA